MREQQYKCLLFTAGRGPVECQLALMGIQSKFRKYLEGEGIAYRVYNQKRGQLNRSLETIVFKIEASSMFHLEPWLGTLQWVSKSPIRRYSKRKNWYVKCVEVQLPEGERLDLKDITFQAYKSSGPGGQHRNKVETAVRIIHNPTGIIVTSSDSKSKAQNKKRAMDKLMHKLELKNTQKQKELDYEEWSSKLAIERGNPSKVFRGSKFLEGN